MLTEFDANQFLSTQYDKPADASKYFLINPNDSITQILSSSGEHGVKLRLHEYKKQNGLCRASDAYEMTIESEQHRVEVLGKIQAQLTEKLRQEFPTFSWICFR